MKALKSLVAAALVLAGSSAFAAGLRSVTVDNSGGQEALRWSSQCVVNVLDKEVKVSYLYGEDGENAAWKELTIPANEGIIFSERFATQQGPMAITVKFLNKEEGGTELSYALEDTVTIVRPVSCNRVENYEFQATDAGEGSFDLVHIER